MTDAVCVLGVSGFVGSHVAAELLQRGIHVRGALRDPDGNRGWLERGVAAQAANGAALTLHQADLNDAASIKGAMSGCTGVAMCAGIESQDPSTIDLMVGAAEKVCDAALELGVASAVFTSSTGSTNPPDGEPALKREMEHWSDPDAQIAAGKFSPAAKTLMDRTALARMEGSNERLRVCTINPSLITGPAFQPEPVPSLRFFQAIIRGERMQERVPNGSMSMIHISDLARLHVNALLQDSARGRYFGVQQSWHWRDILDAIQRALPTYRPPPWPAEEMPAQPTQFDTSRRDSVWKPIHGLDDIIAAVVSELKRRAMMEGASE